jgi:sigma54-dependent transcription regulator
VPELGSPGTETVTVAFAVALEDEFVQVTAYCVVLPGLTGTEPDVAPPVENPFPVHCVAFVDDQVRSDCSPRTMALGFATNDAVTDAAAHDVAVTGAPDESAQR